MFVKKKLRTVHGFFTIGTTEENGGDWVIQFRDFQKPEIHEIKTHYKSQEEAENSVRKSELVGFVLGKW